MIIFKKIKYKNLLSVGNNFIEVSLNDHHTTLLLGESGAGKTVILDAISFALFNKPFRNISKTQIVNSVNDKNCLVELEFSLGSDNFLIRRGAKPNIFEIFKNDTLVNQDSHNKDYQDILEKQILKFNYRSFSQIVVLGACNFVPFMQLKAADRRAIIENLLDIEIFSMMNSNLKSKISTNKEQLVSLGAKIIALTEKLELHIEYSKKEKVNKTDIILLNENKLVEHKQTILKLIKEKEKLEQTLAIDKDLIEKQKTDLQQLGDKSKLTQEIFELKTNLNQKKNILSVLQKDMQFYKDNDSCPTCKQHIEQSFREDTKKDKHEQSIICDSAISTVERDIEVKNKSLIDFEQKETIIKSNISLLEKTIRNTEYEASSKKSSISVTVDFCKKIEAEIEALKNSAEKEKEDFTQRIKDTQNQISDCEEQKKILLKEKENFSVCSELLHDSGVKAKIIKQYIDLINQYTNKFLTAMNFFVQFNLDEEFNEQIRSVGKDVFSYMNFSEGEKQRIDIALLFTWRTIAKMKNSVNTNLLILDEIMDSFLDLNASEHILQMLKTVIARDNNVLIISHKNQLSEKVDRTLNFCKKSGFTAIT